MWEFSDTPLPPVQFLKTQLSQKTWENFSEKKVTSLGGVNIVYVWPIELSTTKDSALMH